MDSLRILHDSLDSSRAPTAGASKRNEKKLNQDFKAAALHLTNLYRGSLTSSVASYRSGYLGGLRDILDLVLLRGTQDSDRPDRLEAFLACDDSLQDGGGGAGPSRGPSQQELRWLARYLKARIEAIKSESDEEEAETTDNEATSSSQQQAESGSAARRSGGRSAQDVVDRRQRTASEVSEEQAYRSPAPTEPNTPAHPRYQGQTNTSSSSGIELAASGSAAPSSSFSFAMASPGMSSPNFAVSTATGTTSASRRRTRGLPSSHSHQSSSPASGRGRQNTNSTPLSPVGEEAMLPGTGGFDHDDDDDDGMEDIREERGNGRRGPLMMHRGDAMGERPKRRRKTAAVEKIGPVTHASIGREDRRRGGGGGEDDSAAR